MPDQIGTFEESLVRYHHLIEHSRDVIYWANSQGEFTFFGPIAVRTFGYPREELLGRHYLDLVRPDMRRTVRHFYDLQWTKRTPHTYLEFPAITKDGAEVWLGQNAHLIQTGTSPSGFQVIARNITAEKQAREELESVVAARTAELRLANEALTKEAAERRNEEEKRHRIEEQLRQVQRLDSLGLMAGGVAHEFNNLLMIVSGYAEILRVGIPEQSKYIAYLDRMLAASRRGGELAQQMLDYAGKGKLEAEAINLSRVLNESTPLLEEAVTGRAKLFVELAEDLPEFRGDPHLVRQVAVNLITNAVEALDPAGGTIYLRTKSIDASQAFFSSTYFGEQMAPGEYVSMEVIDNGCGMDDATQNRIFEPFFSTKFMGRGLGLASVLGIVKSHDGAIAVRSAPGAGTTIQLVFPVVRSD